MAAAGFAVISLGLVLASAPLLDPVAWDTGAADAAFVTFIVVCVLLAVRWRLVGEAPAVSYLAASALIGLLVVPATKQMGTTAGYVNAMQASAVFLAALFCLDAVRAPDVRSRIKPTVVVAGALGTALVVALPMSLSPARLLVTGQGHGSDFLGLVEGSACLGVAAVLLIRGRRRGRTLAIWFGSALPAVALAGVSRPFISGTRGDPLVALPSLSLLAAALVVLAGSSGDLRRIVRMLVLEDVRGRRRWKAAEREMARLRDGYQGQHHDIKSVLSAVDGTLFVLSDRRDRLTGAESDRMIRALRQQVRWLQALFVGSESRSSDYDLSELLQAIVAVRSVGGTRVRCDVEPGLHVKGRPDRLAIIVHNLLSNASVHARGAGVALAAKRVEDDPLGEAVEIVVADHGPGLEDSDLVRATERGWRGQQAALPGNGLGLYQCRDMAEAEGGRILLGPTDAFAPAGYRGLTARVRIPVGARSR